jgi:MFS family permease
MQSKFALSNIFIIGLVSLFIDMSTEMIYPLIPLFLTTNLGATPAIVGVIEGIAECTASVLKVFSGYIGDIYQNKKKLTFLGYSASIVYKVALLLSTSWTGVLAARVIDRIGKGIRVAPRDALVEESSDKDKLGRSYGLHKMLDIVGSALGVLLAYFIVTNEVDFETAFLYSIIPAVIGVLMIGGVQEKCVNKRDAQKFTLKGVILERKLKLYLGAMFIFCLGNSSNIFLLLRAKDCGFSPSEVILLYLAFNVSASLLSMFAGKLSDKIGRRRIIVPGYLVFALVYLGFGFLTSKLAIIILFIAYGVYTAFNTAAERAFIAETAPVNLKGTILGLHGMLQGFGLLLSSIIAGLLWDYVGPSAPFLFGGVMGLISAVAITIILDDGSVRKA